jgi:hypothetical protein
MSKERRTNAESAHPEHGRLEHDASKVLQPKDILLASIAISLKRIADYLEGIDSRFSHIEEISYRLEGIADSLDVIAIPTCKSPPP